MAISGKYGPIVISAIGDTEPVFVLRAQDKLATAAIDMYRVLAESHGLKLADSLKEEMERFKFWEGTRKMPD
jgi:hypothetical protein